MDRDDAVQPRGRVLQVRRLRSRLRRTTASRSRSRSAASPTRRSRSAAPRPTSSASGASRRRNYVARSTGSTPSPRAPADRHPRIWVTFRPIIAATDAQAWEKAHEYVGKIGRDLRGGENGGFLAQQRPARPAERRLAAFLDFAAASELYDRALWTKTAAATGGLGASTALVGSPETVAAAIIDYIDAGANLVSIRGYDTLADAVEYGQHVLPLVRQEIAHRKATRQRGTLQSEHLGNYTEAYRTLATAGRA